MTHCFCRLCVSNSYARGGYVAPTGMVFMNNSWHPWPLSASGQTPAVERTPLPVEHTAQALRGFRTWSLRYDNQRELDWWRTRIGSYGEGPGPTPGKLLPGLFGWSASTSEWTAPVTVAECPSQPSKQLFAEWYGTPNILAPHAPDRDCKCGLYAWHRPENVEGTTVVGVVEAAGRVLWAPYGWRAEKARIVAVYGKTAAVREMVAATHPEAKLYDSLDVMLADWPAEVEAPEAPPEDPYMKAFRDSMTRSLGLYGAATTTSAAIASKIAMDINGLTITAVKRSRTERFTDWMVKHPVKQVELMTATFAFIAFLLGLAFLLAGLVPAVALVGFPARAAGGYLAGTALFQGVKGIAVLAVRLGRKRG